MICVDIFVHISWILNVFDNSSGSVPAMTALVNAISEVHTARSRGVQNRSVFDAKRCDLFQIGQSHVDSRGVRLFPTFLLF